MKIVVKKSGVGYGVNGSDAAVTDLANVDTLKVGSFLFAFDNGNVVKVDGTITTASNKPAETGIIYYNDGLGVRASMPITLATAKLIRPLPDTAKAAKVVTIDLTYSITDDTVEESGVYILDNTLPTYDNSRESYHTIAISKDVLQATFNAKVLASVKANPCVASASIDGGDVLTITFVEGKNPVVKGIGFFQKTTVTVSTPMLYRDWETDRKSTRLNSSHSAKSRMPSSA